nr:hypothetical protein [uncultured Flavobacterium sp.]
MKKCIYLISGVFTFLVVGCKKADFKPELQNPEYKIDESVINQHAINNKDSLSFEYGQTISSGLFSSTNKRFYVINYFVDSEDKYSDKELEEMASELNNLAKENLVNINEFDAVEIRFQNSNKEIFKEVAFKIKK